MKTSIVIPTFNHCDSLLKPCLESVIKYTKLDETQFVIVANGCTDNTFEYLTELKAKHPTLNLDILWSVEALGYTVATNRGIRASTGEFVVLLNNDITLLEWQDVNGWIDMLRKPFDSDPKVAISGTVRQWCAHSESYFMIFFCVMIRRTMFDEIGLLDEVFNPGYGEDIAWCFEAQKAGYKMALVPDEEQKVDENGQWITHFPLYHAPESTMKHNPKWVDIVSRNSAILKERYRLPDGWFTPEDIQEYRRLVREVPDGGTIAELGVAEGRSLSSIADLIVSKHLKLVVVDTFKGTVSEGKGDEAFRPLFESNIKKRGLSPVIYEMTTDEAASKVTEQFDLIFIDADHEAPSVQRDIQNWAPKIKKGGTLAGHDYWAWASVTSVVNAKFTNVRTGGTVWSSKNPTDHFKQKMNGYEISIVVPTFNRCDQCLKPCIDSLLKYTDMTNVELVISANGCTDNTMAYLHSLPETAHVKIVWEVEAQGFIKATNAGIKAATGQFIVLINNDVVFLPQSFNQWMDFLKNPFNDPTVGITGTLKCESKDASRDFIVFSCAMISRKVFDKIGLLDETFSPGGGDDIDFSIKAEEAGFRLVQVPRDNRTWVNGGFVNEFPIWHPERSTFKDVKDFGDILQRNMDIIRQRYGRKNQQVAPAVAKEPITITVAIATRNRHDTLANTLLSMAFQTRKPDEIVIVDDSDDQSLMKKNPTLIHMFNVLDRKGIPYRIGQGPKKGLHYSHELVQTLGTGNWIFRIDDDENAEPDVLENLTSVITEKVGAVAPLVLFTHETSKLPPGLTNSIYHMDQQNVQWFDWHGTMQADHLHSCFLYRRNVAHYELSLGKKGFREETLLSHTIKRAGYDLLVNGDARVWHFRADAGGCRGDGVINNDEELYAQDERTFRKILAGWGIGNQPEPQKATKMIVLNNGLGDHLAFRQILPEVKKKYPQLVLATCYPGVFETDGVPQISIAEAQQRDSNMSQYDLYDFCWKNKWSRSIVDAFREMYLK